MELLKRPEGSQTSSLLPRYCSYRATCDEIMVLKDGKIYRVVIRRFMKSSTDYTKLLKKPIRKNMGKGVYEQDIFYSINSFKMFQILLCVSFLSFLLVYSANWQKVHSKCARNSLYYKNYQQNGLRWPNDSHFAISEMVRKHPPGKICISYRYISQFGDQLVFFTSKLIYLGDPYLLHCLPSSPSF